MGWFEKASQERNSSRLPDGLLILCALAAAPQSEGATTSDVNVLLEVSGDGIWTQGGAIQKGNLKRTKKINNFNSTDKWEMGDKILCVGYVHPFQEAYSFI